MGNDVISIMEKLREDDWCVVLKCLPDGFPWIVDGDHSEYGGSGEPTVVSREVWCAEASCMRRGSMENWRNSQFSNGGTPIQAMQKLDARIAADAKAMEGRDE